MSLDLRKEIERLEEENRELKASLAQKTRVAAKALANYQQRALHMEIIRQQNEDLDNLAHHLTQSKQLAEKRARESEDSAIKLFQANESLTKTLAELELSEKQNRILVDTAAKAGIGIVVIEGEELGLGKIQYANSKVLAIWGYTQQEILGMRLLDLIHPNDQNGLNQKGLDLPQQFEYLGITKDQSEIPIAISSGETIYNNENALVCYISDISARKAAEAKLAETQKELIEKAHQAGMAAIASNTLHNVGNILNSVMTSAQIIYDMTTNSQVAGLKKANTLLREHIDTIEEFICHNPNGKKLLSYYLMIEEGINDEHDSTVEHVNRLLDKIGAISEVIKAQQSYAGTANALTEKYRLHEIVEDTLTMQAEIIDSFQIRVEKCFHKRPHLYLQKSKLVHIIINLIKNAKEAMFETPVAQRNLKFTIDTDETHAYLKVTDSGKGIPANDITRIFNHGYTTKKKGHGFGLHSCANYMTEMRGSIRAESSGEQQGATFILKFPL